MEEDPRTEETSIFSDGARRTLKRILLRKGTLREPMLGQDGGKHTVLGMHTKGQRLQPLKNPRICPTRLDSCFSLDLARSANSEGSWYSRNISGGKEPLAKDGSAISLL